MNAITTAILAAVQIAASDVVKSSVKDAYNGLKSVIHNKWGKSSQVAKAVDDVEVEPNSSGHAALLDRELTNVKATEDTEIMVAMKHLLAELNTLRARPEPARQINVTVSGGTVQGIVGVENANVSELNFGVPSNRNPSSGSN